MLAIKDIRPTPHCRFKCQPLTRLRTNSVVFVAGSVLASVLCDKSGGDIPCRGLPHTRHASAFKVISAPQHEQKAATLFNLHNRCNCLDERRKCKDSRRSSPYIDQGMVGPAAARARRQTTTAHVECEIRRQSLFEEFCGLCLLLFAGWAVSGRLR
jgi:hypothetical protein